MIRHEVTPIPIKRRPRFRRSGKPFLDNATKADIQRVRESWDGDFYSDQALALIIDVYQVLPESKAKLVRQQFTIKPDVDNIIKAIMDGLNGKAYVDDKQIVMVMCVKHDRTLEIDGEYVSYVLLPIKGLRKEWNCQTSNA